MNVYRWIIRTDEPFRGITQSYTYKGVDNIEYVAYSDMTLEEYEQDRDYPFKLITDSELDELITKYEQSRKTTPKEITEQRYYDMLECLPPQRYSKGAFHMSERLYSNIVDWFFIKNGKYYNFTDFDNITNDQLEQIIRKA